MNIYEITNNIVGVLTCGMGRLTLFQLNRPLQNIPNYPLAGYGITNQVLQLGRNPRLHTIITENIDLAILLAKQRALLTPVTCPDTKFIGITCTFIQMQVATEKHKNGL